jgi:uncharacterized RDD family membrane protein YckC
MKTSMSMVVSDTSGVYPDEQIVTGEAVALELRLAGAGSRGIAAVVDLLVMAVAQIAIFLLIIATDNVSLAAALTIVLSAEVLILLGYPVAMETLWHGQTLGKAMMGLRVVRDDGGPIRFRHAFVRGLVGLFLDKPGITSGLFALIPMIATTRKKRMGDILAGTMVLQDRVPGRLEAPVMMPPPLAGWAASLDLSGIDDALALRMRHFLGRAAALSPAARATLEHQLASEAAAKVGTPPAGTPAWAIISAVLAERRRRAFTATHQVPQWPSHAPTVAAPTTPYVETPLSEPATAGDGSSPQDVAPPGSGFAAPG